MRALRGSTATVLGLAALVSGCFGALADSTDPPAHRPLGATEPAAEVSQPILFEKCSLETGGQDGRAECANVEVPLDWSAPAASKVTFFVKRLRGTSSAPHRQLWLLQGGPGNAGDGLERLASDIAHQDPSLDVYIPDHRGTGRSARLECPRARGRLSFDYASCLTELKIRWGVDGLATFSTTTAARDVGHVVELTRAAGQEVHIYGVSYGTYWAQRYLQLFPTQPTAVTLDSVCQAGLCSYLKMGYQFDRIGKKYMAECAADAVCSEKLGPDPISRVREAIAAADAGTCGGLKNIRGEQLRQLYAAFIASFELRALVPATTFRILRCNDDDVLALQQFESALGRAVGNDGFAGAQELSSDLLGMHVAFSELEESPPISREALATLLDDAVFTTSSPRIRDVYDAWPRYRHDAWVGKYPNANMPVLLMNGTLDPQTPQEFAETVAPHYARLSQGLVLLPRAAHGVVYQSPIAEAPAPACGMTLWQQFLAAPGAPLDTSCRDRILPHDFGGSTDLAGHFFGRPTLWGGPGPLPAPTATPGQAPGSTTTAERTADLRSRGFASELQKALRVTRPFAQPL